MMWDAAVMWDDLVARHEMETADQQLRHALEEFAYLKDVKLVPPDDARYRSYEVVVQTATKRAGAAQYRLTGGHGKAPTARQLQCLHLVSCGLSGEEMAKVLFLNLRTVRRHLTGARLALGARTIPQAVGIAVRQGLME